MQVALSDWLIRCNIELFLLLTNADPMRFLILLIFLLFVQHGYSSNPTIKLIPYPQQLRVLGDDFPVMYGFNVKVDNEFRAVDAGLKKLVAEWNVWSVSKLDNHPKALLISLIFDQGIENGPEAYRLSVSPYGIDIRSSSTRGCFYGIQTLKQLIQNNGIVIRLPELEITDFPNFSWRSYMLDEARHFYGKTFVLRLIDELAELKINKFHWHLTDDQGWRIEIKKYPKLSQIGAFRKDTQLLNSKSDKRSGSPHGGFYTQDDIREIIAYALARNIDVIPEIEMPGHSSAAIVAYPWLGVLGTITEVPVTFARQNDSYNIANPHVIQFLHDVLDEVCDLFPSQVIHIGGDEVVFDNWDKSDVIQAYLKKNNLKHSVDGQILFANEISNYLSAKGKRMMGWNEILGEDISGSTLASTTIIQFWKGDSDQIRDAAKRGYAVVNSLNTKTYLDYSYKTTPLKKIYNFSPMPHRLDKQYQKNIVGVGAQIWTEWIPTYKDVEYQTFPRIAAVAEVAWSGRHDYSEFISRLKEIGKDWRKRGINFPAEEIK